MINFRGGPLYGHFTVMSRDVNDRIGCCMAQYLHYERKYWWRNTLVTCNYRETNFIGEPVYEKGIATSACSDWGKGYKPSKRYPSLCTSVSGGKNYIDPYYGLESITTAITIQNVEQPNTKVFKPLSVKSTAKPTIRSTIKPSIKSTIKPNSKFLFKSEKSTKKPSYYCQLEKEKCHGSQHIGCENNPTFKFNPECSKDKKLIRFNAEMKDTIIETHNYARHLIAAGALESFPTASRMLEIDWDDELANVACEHVKFCQKDHDNCRATKSYDTPGQNVHFYSTQDSTVNSTIVLRDGIWNWFNEYYAASPDIVDSYKERYVTHNMLWNNIL